VVAAFISTAESSRVSIAPKVRVTASRARDASLRSASWAITSMPPTAKTMSSTKSAANGASAATPLPPNALPGRTGFMNREHRRDDVNESPTPRRPAAARATAAATRDDFA
jgi:hypothetical protein